MAASDSAINGTSDRERIDTLHADVQALTSLVEGFSTRTAADAAMHWQLSGESKARLDHLDQMVQTLSGESKARLDHLDQKVQTLSGESKARLDHLDQKVQTLVDQSAAHAQLLQTLVDQSAAQYAREPERRQ